MGYYLTISTFAECYFPEKQEEQTDPSFPSHYGFQMQSQQLLPSLPSWVRFKVVWSLALGE